MTNFSGIVHCADCVHYVPSPRNPAAGAGACKIDADKTSTRPWAAKMHVVPWPHAERRCSSHKVISKI